MGGSVIVPALFLKESMKSKVYFYGLGQTARTRGLTKEQGYAFYRIDSGLPYASIYFDKGYRGLSL